MSQIVNANDSAFGYGVPGDEKAGWLPESIPGLTKREYFAAMFLAASISSYQHASWPDAKAFSEKGVEYADALIAELSK